jgi:hypothetical protein
MQPLDQFLGKLVFIDDHNYNKYKSYKDQYERQHIHSFVAGLSLAPDGIGTSTFGGEFFVHYFYLYLPADQDQQRTRYYRDFALRTREAQIKRYEVDNIWNQYHAGLLTKEGRDEQIYLIQEAERMHLNEAEKKARAEEILEKIAENRKRAASQALLNNAPV